VRLIGGTDFFSEFNDVWVSTDGVAWKRVVRHAPFSPRYNATLTLTDDGNERTADFNIVVIDTPIDTGVNIDWSLFQ
jgi:hypothetical protein